jgi:hypothetical protein
VNLGEAGQVVRLLEFGWSQKFPPEMALVYVECLRGLPYRATRAGVEAMLRTEEFRPSVAAVCRAATGAPDEAAALVGAERWLAYREQMRFVNGSGYVPVRPDVHTLVVESCAGLSAGMFGWQTRFRGSYEVRVQNVLSGLKELEA